MVSLKRFLEKKYAISIPDEGDNVKQLTVSPAGGIYIALSDHTAMKLGASVNVTRAL